VTDPNALYGPTALLMWLPDYEEASPIHFLNPGPGRSVQRWWSVREAVKFAAGYPRFGMKPWIYVNNQVVQPHEIYSTSVQILRQDHEDAVLRQAAV